VGPGLHYRWPWPVERVKKADVEGIRRLVVGYMTNNREAIILWTNKHYLREYSVITGEGPFLDVAMNLHYRISDLYDYLFNNADPDGTTEKVAYQVLRETFGARPLFSSITADRDALENLILTEIQRRTNELALGIQVQSVCFRDLHPPTQVAAAFEDVVSAQEDYETYIEQARGYQMDLLPRARASATTTVNDARAYRNAIIAQSIGRAQSFSLQEKAYSKAPDLTRTRMLLEALEEALASVPKYVVGPGKDSETPDLWFHMPSLARGSSAPGTALETGTNKAQDSQELTITDEGDLMDALVRFQRGQRGNTK
jgi:membrane protease subunit HflK